MRRTLLLIPHEIAGLPVFGFGWALMIIAVAFVGRLFVAHRSGSNWQAVLGNEGFMWGLGAVLVTFIMPVVELQNVAGDPVGMAIRGYGVLLLTAVGSAVLFAAYRAKKRGIDPEAIFSMAPWTFIGGIVGARLFYVIQYRDDFIGDTFGQTLRNMFAFTEGGLVVYGGFIGGFLASVYYIRRHKLPLLTLGDVIVPCMLLGVFFGRAGCLMNGCCYGGRCEASATSIEFPVGSPVYMDQMRDGSLIGMKFDAKTQRVTSVSSGSLAEQYGVKTGQTVMQISLDDRYRDQASPDIPKEDAPFGLLVTVGTDSFTIPPDQLPDRALPVRAAQVISSLTAISLFVVLLVISPLIKRTGVLMFVGFAGYAIVRFVLEIVRVDEGGQFGTNLSISQWVSLVVLTLSIGGIIYLMRSNSETTDVKLSVSDEAAGTA